MSLGKFKCNKTNPRYAVREIKKRIRYLPATFGFRNLNGDGSDAKICIIDTGYPSHKDIPVQMSNVIDFTQSKELAKDIHGHSTGISGILKAQGKSIAGIAPKAECFYAKGLNDEGEGDHGAIQASLLYAIVKRVDIIVMPFGSECLHPVLHDAIRKANREGIVMFASSGNHSKRTRDADYPARFPEVMSVGLTSGSKVLPGSYEALNMDFPIKSIDTTYLNNMYVKMRGSSIAAPIAAGIAAIILQKYSTKTKRPAPQQLYRHMLSLCK